MKSKNGMRKIEWDMIVNPTTFQPEYVCIIEGEKTGVLYTMDVVQDLTAQYDKDQYICDIKAIINENLINLTDLTDEEREFALDGLVK